MELNHYNEEIVVRYPLASHLTHRLVGRCFDLPIIKETSLISLMVSCALKKLIPRLSVLLVSNQSIPIVEQIEAVIYHDCTAPIGEVRTVPVYYYNSVPEIAAQYDVLLTTQHEIILSNPAAYLISPIIAPSTSSELDEFLHRVYEELCEEKEQQLRERFLDLQTISEKMSNIYQVIGLTDDGTLSYHSFASNQLHITRIAPNTKTCIRIFDLKHTLTFRHKKVQRIIFSQFCQGDADIMLFYKVVADILLGYA